MKKKFLTFILCICFIIPTMFCLSGCGKTTLKNGNYKVTAYSIDGQSETNYINSYASINGNTMTDWLNNTASIQIKGKTIEFTWSGQHGLTLTGSVSNDIITINEEVNGREYLIVLTYEENVVLKNGNYKVTAYSIDGQSETNYINSYASINGNTMTDWLNNTASIQIKGKTIEFTWSGQHGLTLTGSVSNDIITINEEVNGREYLIVLTYEENVVLKNGNYKVTAYSIDGQSETNYINSYASINGNTMTDWLNNTASIQIKGKTIEFTWSGQHSLTLTGSVSNDIITINEEVNGREYLIVLTYENN